MAEEKKKYNNYHLSVQMSNTFWSYKKPGDNGAYAMMYVTYYNNMLSLHFKRGITSENVLDLSCYIQDGKAFDLSRLLEGMMARRRDAYAEGKNYDADEVIKMPCTSVRDGKEVSVGLLVIDTEMYDGIPRVRVSYTDHEKNDTIEIVFNSRVPSGAIEAKCKANSIDYADIQAFNFVNILKEVQNPLVPIMYRIQDAAVNSITKYISACLSGRNGGNRGDTASYNNNVGPTESYSGDSYEPF
jgi:hypothetical protein